MYKITLSLLIFVNILLASNVKVTKSDITFTLNNKEKEYKVDSIFQVKDGDIICHIKGNGCLEINDNNKSIKIASNTTPCHIVFKAGDDDDPDGEEEDSTIPTDIKPIVVREQNGGEFRGGSKAVTVKKVAKLSKKDKFILIVNKKWAPLPISLEILDKQNRVVKRYINNNDTTQFLVPTDMLKDGYKLQIKNRASKLLLEVEIVKDKK